MCTIGIMYSSASKSKAREKQHVSLVSFHLQVPNCQSLHLLTFQTSCSQCQSLGADRWHCCIRQFCPALKTRFSNFIQVFVNFPTSLYKLFENPSRESSQPLWFWFGVPLKVQRNWVISFLSYVKVTRSNLSTFDIF